MILHHRSEHALIGRQSWKGSIATLLIHAAVATLIAICAPGAAKELATDAPTRHTPLMVDLAPLAAPRIETRRARPATTTKLQESLPGKGERTKNRDIVSTPVERPAPLTPLMAVPSALPPIEAMPLASLWAAAPRPSAAATTAPQTRRSPAPSQEVSRPAVGAASTTSNWSGLVLGRLQQFKRYPARARARQLEGVSVIRFAMDRRGRVLSAEIERSSGHEVLDREAVALVHRAQPLPVPPPGVAGDTIELVVPVEFMLTR